MENSKPLTKNAAGSERTVLFVITKSVWGGAQKYVHDLARALLSRGFRVGVAAGGKDTLYEKLRAHSIPYRDIGYFQRDIAFIKDIAAGIEMIRVLLRARPHVIHASSPKAAGIAGMAAFLCRPLTFFRYTPTMIMTVHGWTFHENRPTLQLFFIRLFSRLTALLYHRIIVISRADYHAALRNRVAPARKLVLIPHGIDAAAYAFFSRDEARHALPHAIANASLLIGSIGEWTANKNYSALIEAAKIIANKNSDARFVLFGWGEQKNLLGNLIKQHNLAHHVFLIEGVTDAARYLKAFDIFALPSIKEGLPYVLLEAQCAGIPIVATAVGGIPEIVNKANGILVQPNRPDLLADAILSINHKMPSNHNEQHNPVRTLDDMIADTIRCYQE